MNSAAVDIMNYLESEGLGTQGTDLFVGKEPDGQHAPVNTVTAYDDGGPMQDARNAINETWVMFRARNTNYETAYNKLRDIRVKLEGHPAITLGNTLYIGFWVMSNIASSGYDDEKRVMMTINFKVIREPVGDAARGHRLAQ